MNEEITENNKPETANQPTRKSGIVADFRTCGDDYLSLISADLGLGATVEQMRILQKVFVSLKRDPNVAELYFSYAALLRARRNAIDDLRLTEAENCTPDMLELLSSFVRRFCKDGVGGTNPPLLTELAEYAATGARKREECGIQICEASARTFPLPYSGGYEAVTAGKYIITLSSGKPISGNTAGDVCVLISPKYNDDIDTFIYHTSEICRRFINEYPETKLLPATERGLLDDIFGISDGIVFDTSLYPEPSPFAESVFLPFNPSLILLPSRSSLPRLWEIAAEFGITPHAAAATRAKFITVKAPEGTVEFDKGFFDLLKQDSDVSLCNLDNSHIEEVGYIPINGESVERRLGGSPHIISARNVGGCNLYEDLADAMIDSEAVYAIVGTIDPADGIFLKSILTLDSFRRNNSPQVVYSRFFIANTTSITVIKLKSEK